MTRILKCVQSSFDTVILPLSDINSVLDTIRDIPFSTKLKKSLEQKGMLNPILVCTDTDFKQTDIRQFENRPVSENIKETYRCLIGNNRYKYAEENGYTHIECHIVKTYEEVKKAHRKTQIEPRKM